MTNNDTERDVQWDLMGLADPYPHLPAPTVTVTPWTPDADLVEAVADLTDVYPGADAAVLVGLLRDLRGHLREAVMEDAAASALRSVRDGLADRVTDATTDEELALLVAGAEAGRGGAVPGLLVALEDLRCGAADAAA